MTVSELMTGKTPSESYAGWVMADDMVLAIEAAVSQGMPDASTSVANYVVVQGGIKSVGASLNAEEQTNGYIRAGKSSVKTSTQRTFEISGDRLAGDAFQEYVLSNAVKYGVGQACVVNYVYFNILTGKGEIGMVSVLVNSDGSGETEQNSGISVTLKKTGPVPVEFKYS